VTNSYYGDTGTPGYRSFANSRDVRTEFQLVESGFDKLPSLTATYFWRTNAAGTSGEAISPADARTALGATTIGDAFFRLTNPGVISFPRINADNSLTALTASDTRAALGGTTVGQALFMLSNPSSITFLRVNADNSVTALTAAQLLTALGATTVGSALLQLTNPSAISFPRINANNSITAISIDDLTTDLDLGTMASQDHDSVNIIGGTISDTSVTLNHDDVTVSGSTLTINVFENSVFRVTATADFTVDITGTPQDATKPVPFRIVVTNPASWEVLGLTRNGSAITVFGWDDQTINLKPSGRTVLDCLLHENQVDVFCYQMSVA
jgi:hypothetical protein